VGSHSVGGIDGPGLPLTGWSVEHGDLRVPHFIGLHALQALALVAIGLRRLRGAESVRIRVMIVAAASYAVVFVLLLLQSLRGHSIMPGMPS
jgi:hypothetical protein